MQGCSVQLWGLNGTRAPGLGGGDLGETGEYDPVKAKEMQTSEFLPVLLRGKSSFLQPLEQRDHEPGATRGHHGSTDLQARTGCGRRNALWELVMLMQ